MLALIEPINLLAFIYGADDTFLLPELAIAAKFIAVFETDVHHTYTALRKTT